tara:strand:+ start:12091 stop:12486 length:396 start_codon:yes stop_codon:yes gene_type:complete
MSWTFEKVDIELLDNLNLNSHEKLIYILLRRFKNCKNGINVTNKYLMRRTGIKSEATLRKYVDNLTLFGLIARQQPDRNKPNRYTFDRNEMQHIIRMNRGKRKKISDNIKLKLHEKKLNEEITKGKIVKLK